MFPRRFNYRQLAHLMKQFGINVRELEGVEEVIIRTRDKEYVFENPEVTIMEIQGKETYQIAGSPQIKEKKREEIPKEDVLLVMEKTGKTEEEARRALEETKGDIAEAILKLTGE
ncbi:MAG: nascent polypeptide-associated complex protein [Thermoplasmata archaeon]|nr:MAG: nascent polypeptide-associated complex protein [Thermoplasmata archaeon]